MIGTTLSHFNITAKLGEGGMGVVYRAEDTKLEREVAIKVLPEAVASDRQRLARFEREAKVLASLNHPNIAAIYEVGEAAEVHFLAMELAEGEDLAARLSRGPIPVEDTLPLALQIAEALEAAHEKGIVHRDLKPANVMVTDEYRVKVLDFGLAKALEPRPMSGAESLLAESPTLTAHMTQPGVVFGTAAYMSPEQARGKRIDQRTDIWSFGCLLFEMLAGRRAFEGESINDIVARVIGGNPHWELLPADTPASIRRLLGRCLNCDPTQRLQAMGEARITLSEVEAGGGGQDLDSPTGQAETPLAGRLGWLVAVALAVALASSLLYRSRSGSDVGSFPEPASVSVSLGPGTTLDSISSATPFAIARDGTQLAWVGHDERGTRLYLRRIGRFDIVEVPGTVSARGPFFSPEGEWVGFFSSDGKLRKVSSTGGSPLVVCNTGYGSFGGTWGSDGTIVFAGEATAGLLRVAATGGDPEVLTTVDRTRGETRHAHPQFLPGGKALVFTILRGDGIEEAEIAIVTLADGKIRPIHRGGTQARYSPQGYIHYGDSKGLVALPFDVERLEVTGSPSSVLPGVYTPPWFGTSLFALSDTGTLVFVTRLGQEPNRRLVLVDANGTEQPVAPGVERPFYWPPRLSPEGRRLLVDISENDRQDIWLHEFDRGVWTRLTFDAVNNAMPIWTPDGRSVVFTSNATGLFQMYRMPADGSRPPEWLLEGTVPQIPTSWDPTGHRLAFYQIHPETYRDLWVFDTQENEAMPFLRTPADERAGMFSPDGRWIAYVSDESDRDQIYVRPYPAPGGKWQISTDGGTGPLWSKNGKRLYYREGRALMAVDVSTGVDFSAGSPRLLFAGDYLSDPNGNANYDVTPDGRFLMISGEQIDNPTELQVVIGWFDVLEEMLE